MKLKLSFSLVAFTRTLGARKVLVAANLTKNPSEGGKLIGTLKAYEFIIRPL